MTYKTILSTLVLILCSSLSTKEATVENYILLPQVEIISYSIEKGIYDALTQSHDSVKVLNGYKVEYITVRAIDSTLAKIILAQAYLESGSFLSPLARLHNNYYGMRHPSRGKLTTSLGPYARAEGRKGYASYTSPEDSAIDLVLLLDYYHLSHGTSTPEKYVHLLKTKHYFESSEKQYLNNLKYHLSHVNNLFQIPL